MNSSVSARAAPSLDDIATMLGAATLPATWTDWYDVVHEHHGR